MENITDAVILPIPYGAELTLSETGNARYTTSTQVGAGDVTKGLTVTLAAAVTIEDLTVKFTNTEVLVAPTGYSSNTAPFLMLLVLGAVLCLFAVSDRRRKKAA